MSSRSRVATHVIRKWFLWHFERCWIISKGQMCLNSSGSHTHACRNSSQKNSFYAGWIPTGGHVFDDEFFSTGRFEFQHVYDSHLTFTPNLPNVPMFSPSFIMTNAPSPVPTPPFCFSPVGVYIYIYIFIQSLFILRWDLWRIECRFRIQQLLINWLSWHSKL